MAKTTADKFAEAIQKELDKYGEDVQKTVAQLRTSVGKAGLRTLKSASRSTFGGTGKYASGWTMTEEGEFVLMEPYASQLREARMAATSLSLKQWRQRSKSRFSGTASMSQPTGWSATTHNAARGQWLRLK